MNGPHLTWAELACHDGTAYPAEWQYTRAVRLAEAFEAVRASCGDQPIAILSAYRTAPYNRRIGGAKHSQHVQGRALDLRPPAGFTIDKFYEQVLLLARTTVPSIRGVGRYPTFVHMDVRPGPHLATWPGSRPNAEMTG